MGRNDTIAPIGQGLMGDTRPEDDAGSLIALAEDDLALRALLASALEIVGHRVIPVGTGALLFDLVGRLVQDGEPLHLVVTDVRMPAMGGLDAARLLRQVAPAVPLIFMTAYGDAWTRRQAEDLGGVLLDKPLRIADLRQAVDRALSR